MNLTCRQMQYYLYKVHYKDTPPADGVRPHAGLGGGDRRPARARAGGQAGLPVVRPYRAHDRQERAGRAPRTRAAATPAAAKRGFTL